MSVLFVPGTTPTVLAIPSTGTSAFVSPVLVVTSTFRKVHIETPTGTKNGVNVAFVITRTPVNILGFYINGMYQLGGTFVSTTVTLPFAPISTDTLEIIYDSLT